MHLNRFQERVSPIYLRRANSHKAPRSTASSLTPCAGLQETRKRIQPSWGIFILSIRRCIDVETVSGDRKSSLPLRGTSCRHRSHVVLSAGTGRQEQESPESLASRHVRKEGSSTSGGLGQRQTTRCASLYAPRKEALMRSLIRLSNAAALC